MAVRALGRITVATPGTSVRVTVNESDPAVRFPAHIMFFQRNVPSETGKIYIMSSQEGNPATSVGVIAILAAPIIDNPLPVFRIGISYASAGLDLRDYYIDADIGGEGCIVSALRA